MIIQAKQQPPDDQRRSLARKLSACFLSAFVLGAATLAQETAPPAQVAIYRDDIPASGAPASSDELARLLPTPAFECAFLDSQQLADPAALNRQRFDVLVLPYGASFPVKAAANFRKFLRDGGKFFSTGGYAFDNLLEHTTNGWSIPTLPPSPKLDHVAWHRTLRAADLRGKGTLTLSAFMKTAAVPGPGMA